MKVKYIIGKPPHWRIIKHFFPTYNPNGNVSVVLGNRIYANRDIPDDYKVHEETHAKQQKYSLLFGIIWWVKYIYSKEFRYLQELEAYRVQTGYVLTSPKYKSIKSDRIKQFAKDLSGELYGNMVSEAEAYYSIMTRNEKKSS